MTRRRSMALFGVVLLSSVAAASAVTWTVMTHDREAHAAASPPAVRPSPSTKPAPHPRAALAQLPAVNAMNAFNRELGRTVTTGKTAKVRSLTTSGCACRADIDSIASLHKEGPIRAAHFVTARLSETPRTSGDGLEVSIPVRVTLGTWSRLSSHGKVIQVEPRHPNVPSVYTVRKSGQKWKVSDIGGPPLYDFR